MCRKAAEIDRDALLVYSPRLFPDANGIIVTIEGTGLITPITEARFEKWVEISIEEVRCAG